MKIHVGGLNLRQLQDKRGEDLVQGVLALVDEHRPLHLSLEACIFAQTTHTISADLKSKITPCQFGGNPDLFAMRLLCVDGTGGCGQLQTCIGRHSRRHLLGLKLHQQGFAAKEARSLRTDFCSF
ncbi:MAG TPA: hypothetical protein VE176_13500 [Candidatus Limnocylindrales bacterium]|nr:hypothetical protein [Candidatus Limnocylindrales bacterium]